MATTALTGGFLAGKIDGRSTRDC